MIKGFPADLDGILVDSGHSICSTAIFMFEEVIISVFPGDL
jgi:phosphoglycolate phosphatase-like HAD superfamily hydrolase